MTDLFAFIGRREVIKLPSEPEAATATPLNERAIAAPSPATAPLKDGAVTGSVVA